ncbi:MAG TPA: hypothetical protein VE732_02780 [Nitrososphaera sp.]|nr:hypothetical protein [Nitrososphaera sp.]
MAISQRQAEKLYNWIYGRTGGKLVCEICQEQQWSPDIVATFPQAEAEGRVIIGDFDLDEDVVPLAIIVCLSCGNTKMFSAIKLELLKEQESDAPTNGKKIEGH